MRDDIELMIILVLIGMIVLCVWGYGIKHRDDPKPAVVSGYTVKVIDGCEYLVLGASMAHKGNCQRCASEREVE